MDKKAVKYLVFDIESVPDARLIRMVKYPGQDIDDSQAIKNFQDEVLANSQGVSSFIPVTFQYPVSICVAKIAEDFTMGEMVSLDFPKFRPAEMTRLFWDGVENNYSEASLVSFNGRGFDIPLLELMAYRYAVPLKRHLKDKFGARYRFGTRHIDLHDWLSNFNAIKMQGGLNLLAKVLEIEPRGFVVPAHIWTPWFSLFGSNSGFDAIEECFGDLTGEVFAVETGLSSDPSMNWRLSALDKYETQSFIPGVLYLHRVENSGAAFGLLPGAGSFIALGAVAAAALIVLVVHRLERRLEMVAMGLVLGGALGNLADRIFRGSGLLDGKVVDFLRFDFWESFPAFNVADSAITIGACLAVFAAFVMTRRGVAPADTTLPPPAGDADAAG